MATAAAEIRPVAHRRGETFRGSSCASCGRRRFTSSSSSSGSLARAHHRPLRHLADDPADYRRRRLVEVSRQAEPADVRELPRVFDNDAITSSLWTTLVIAIGGTVLPIFIAALAGYAFAWLEFPGRDWLFIGVIALLVVPLQMALIPIFRSTTPRHLRHDPSTRPLPHGVRPAVRDLPAPQLLHRDPEGAARGCPDRRGLRAADLLPPDPAARAPGDRLTRHLPVPLDLERPARGADVRPQTCSRSPSPSSPSMRQFGANIELIAPASFVSLAVPLIVFFAFQRYFVQGLLAGSVK